jgi:DNA-binding NarL/FixJ family response regulator
LSLETRWMVSVVRFSSGITREIRDMTAPAKKASDNPTQVFLFIENRLVRETLVRLFRKRPDICVVGQSSPTEAEVLPDRPCDIVVLDDLVAASELGASFQVARDAESDLGMVLIGMEEDEEQFLTAVRSGVSGYLLNDASASEVVAAVRAVARGEAMCPPKLCRALMRFVGHAAREMAGPVRQRSCHGLTVRQQQLVSLVAKGMTNKEIASQLNLSEFTIKNHIHRIMKQVEAESRHEVVQAVRASGYIELVGSRSDSTI